MALLQALHCQILISFFQILILCDFFVVAAGTRVKEIRFTSLEN